MCVKDQAAMRQQRRQENNNMITLRTLFHEVVKWANLGRIINFQGDQI